MTGEEDGVVATVMAYPIEPVIEKYAREHSVPAELADEHARELKRYLAMCALRPANKYGMRGPVDDLWHTFILFTREYARFCEEAVGYFIHHEPTLPAEREGTSTGERPDPYRLMLRDYEDLFGEQAPPHIWPRGPDLRVRVTAGPDVSNRMMEGSDHV